MTFSRIALSLCTAVTLSGCAYMIPPEESVPRNNVVIGAPHRPQLNESMANQGATSHNQSMHALAQNPAPALPPVDDATKAAASQQMAQMPDAPLVPPVTGDRHVPVENTQYQMSQNDTYPSMMNVPPRPVLSGPDSAKERLTAVHSDLVQDRAAADASRNTLAHDAAAEPSMLSQLPGNDAVVPPNDPVIAKPLVIAPLPAPAPAVIPPAPAASKPGAMLTPAENIAPQAMVNPLPPETTGSIPAGMDGTVPSFTPPAPMKAAPAPVPAAPAAPAMTASTAPISYAPAKPAPLMLKRPVESIATQDLPAATAPTASAPLVMASNRPNVTQGDFDPLAAAENAPATMSGGSTTTVNAPATYANDGYMPASRYAARRY